MGKESRSHRASFAPCFQGPDTARTAKRPEMFLFGDGHSIVNLDAGKIDLNRIRFLKGLWTEASAAFLSQPFGALGAVSALEVRMAMLFNNSLANTKKNKKKTRQIPYRLQKPFRPGLQENGKSQETMKAKARSQILFLIFKSVLFSEPFLVACRALANHLDPLRKSRKKSCSGVLSVGAWNTLPSLHTGDSSRPTSCPTARRFKRKLKSHLLRVKMKRRLSQFGQAQQVIPGNS